MKLVFYLIPHADFFEREREKGGRGMQHMALQYPLIATLFFNSWSWNGKKTSKYPQAYVSFSSFSPSIWWLHLYG